MPGLAWVVILDDFAVHLVTHLDRGLRFLALSSRSWLLLRLVLVSVAVNGLINVILYRGTAPLTGSDGVGLGIVNTVANQLPSAAGVTAERVYPQRSINRLTRHSSLPPQWPECWPYDQIHGQGAAVPLREGGLFSREISSARCEGH